MYHLFPHELTFPMSSFSLCVVCKCQLLLFTTSMSILCVSQEEGLSLIGSRGRGPLG